MSGAIFLERLGPVATVTLSHPGKLNAALPGTNSIQHLLTELFKLRAGINVVNVPYNGGGPAMIDLIPIGRL